MSGDTRGLVISARSRVFTVAAGSEEIPALVPKRLRFREPDYVDPVAVGDRVVLSRSGEQGVIEGVEPRRNAISRPASGRPGKRQLLAANLDLAVIVLSAKSPAWKPSTLDRYIVMASAGGIPAAFCLNKIDLDHGVVAAPEMEVYRSLGVAVLFTSALTGEGLDGLVGRLTGATAVFLGPSGVGKTSLVNRLVPDAGRRVAEVSERTRKGIHTTSWVEMLDLPGGGRIVDSPGLRALDLGGLAPEDLARHFPEMAGRASDCRFPDCRHLAEPDCAVKTAVEAGDIAGHRYDSYERIFRSLEQGLG